MTGWYNSYWELLRRLELHLSNVKPAVLKATFWLEKENSLALKVSQILSLNALIELHTILALNHSESRRGRIDAVFELVSITESLHDEDFYLLDPVLMVRSP